MTQFNHTLNAALLATVLCIGAGSAQAATVNYTFHGAVDYGALLGQTYSGNFNFDDAALLGSGEEFLPVNTLNFSFLGSTFNQTSGSAAPEAAFLDGVFRGLSFNVSTFTPAFAVIPGFVTAADSYFAYDNGAGSAGFGSVAYTTSAVPLPAAWSMMLIGLGLLGRVARGRKIV